MRRHARNPISATGLERAFVGRVNRHRPWRLALRFRDASGLAAMDGRRVIVTMTYAELAEALGAIPTGQLLKVDDPTPAAEATAKQDWRAFVRVMKWLREHSGDAENPGGGTGG